MRFKITPATKISLSLDRSAEEKLLADVTIEERDRYLSRWRKFKALNLANWLGIVLVLAAYFLVRLYASNDWWAVLVFGVLLSLATSVWLRVLNCPRCGATYSGGLITIIQRFSSLRKCYGCDLTTSALAMLEKRGY